MPWLFLIWLLAFIGQAALLGIVLYQLITLTDLEADYLNPHEATRSFNKFVLPEYAVQAAISALLLFTGNWALGIIQLALVVYHAKVLGNNKHVADVTEIFRQVAFRRKEYSIKLAFYILSFCWTVYRLIAVGVEVYLTPEGRKAARGIIESAAASFQ